MKLFVLVLCCYFILSTESRKNFQTYVYQPNEFGYNKFYKANVSILEEKEQIDLESNFQKSLLKVKQYLNSFHQRNSSFKKLFNISDSPLILEKYPCVRDILRWEFDLFNGSLYALQMQDSWGKSESGVFEGNVKWIGRYYQCRNAKGPGFRGKHFVNYYGFRFEPSAKTLPLDIAVASCWPDTCDEEAAHYFMYDQFPNLDFLKTVDTEVKNTFTPGTIAAIAITSIFGFYVYIGSLYEFFCMYIIFVDPRQRYKILVSSSLFSNVKKILSTKTPPGNIPTLDGIRVISTAWVVLGHSFDFIGNNVDNPVAVGNALKNSFAYMVVMNGTYSVDTFFCIGGLLVCYLTLKQLNKSQNLSFIPMMYIKRYLRLTPLYAYLILFSVGLYKYMGDGPFWKYLSNKAEEQCRTYWWSNLLYISTLYPISNPCMGWGWYLTADMIYYILSPFIVLLMYYFWQLGLLTTLLIMCASVGLRAWLLVEKNLAAPAIWAAQYYTFWFRLYVDSTYEATWSEKFHGDIYYTPWHRIGPYMVGMMTGYLLFIKKQRIKMNKLVVAIGWFLSIGVGFTIIYSLFAYTKDREFLPPKLNTFYCSTTRTVWAVCVSWVVIACSSGYGGPITKLLNLKLFIPLSRLTYAAYLVHPFVIFWHSGTQEEPIHFSSINMTFQYIANVGITFGVAFLLAVLIEWPMQELLKLALPSKRNASPQQQPIKNELENNQVEQFNILPSYKEFTKGSINLAYDSLTKQSTNTSLDGHEVTPL